MLAEGSLAREFGSSKEIVKSVVEALQGKSNPQQAITNSIEIAKEVGNCHYEYQTSWGKTVILSKFNNNRIKSKYNILQYAFVLLYIIGLDWLVIRFNG